MRPPQLLAHQLLPRAEQIQGEPELSSRSLKTGVHAQYRRPDPALHLPPRAGPEEIGETDRGPEERPIGVGLLAGGDGLTARGLPAGALITRALVSRALGHGALAPGAHDFAAERGVSRRRMEAPIRVPAIVRLRAALAALPLPPIQNHLDPGGAFERLREMVVELRLPARHHDEEPAPVAHENDLNELS